MPDDDMPPPYPRPRPKRPVRQRVAFIPFGDTAGEAAPRTPEQQARERRVREKHRREDAEYDAEVAAREAEIVAWREYQRRRLAQQDRVRSLWERVLPAAWRRWLVGGAGGADSRHPPAAQVLDDGLEVQRAARGVGRQWKRIAKRLEKRYRAAGYPEANANRISGSCARSALDGAREDRRRNPSPPLNRLNS